jgi:hypothetical protein
MTELTRDGLNAIIAKQITDKLVANVTAEVMTKVLAVIEPRLKRVEATSEFCYREMNAGERTDGYRRQVMNERPTTGKKAHAMHALGEDNDD